MGTGPFAVPSFEALRASGQHDLLMVITRPIKNFADAKTKSVANPVRAWADQHQLKVIDPPTINDDGAIALVSQLQPDLLVVCDYGEILSSTALTAARLGGINLHGSLLPRHRGAAPVQWSILRGDKITGACAIHMTPRLDGGPVISRVTTAIGVDETAGELEKRLSELGVECCLDAISKLDQCMSLEECEELGERQDSSLATPAPRLAKSDGQLDFRYPTALIDRQIRGLQPWPGAFGNIRIGDAKELRVIVGKASILGQRLPAKTIGDQSLLSEQAIKKVEPGEIFWGPALRKIFESVLQRGVDGEDRVPLMVVACDDGYLEIEQIQPAGKKMQLAREFLAGYGKTESLRFLVPQPDVAHRLLEKMRPAK